jgi:orotidine-5'-phosphate decarboxylase
MLCVGLDTDLAKLPNGIPCNLDGMLEFNRIIIDATQDLTAAYKINYAFYEQYGHEGFRVIEQTMKLIPSTKFIIADAKRGDIGNTSKSYAKACFEALNSDAITVNPYMGSDSVKPFLEYSDKMVFLLALTSNPGSNDFQRLTLNDEFVYQRVIKVSSQWADYRNLGYVIGATHPEELKEIRQSIPSNPLLIPGVGTQGGDIDGVISANNGGVALINVSRDIIYAGKDSNFADHVRIKTEFYKSKLIWE